MEVENIWKKEKGGHGVEKLNTTKMKRKSAKMKVCTESCTESRI